MNISDYLPSYDDVVAGLTKARDYTSPVNSIGDAVNIASMLLPPGIRGAGVAMPALRASELPAETITGAAVRFGNRIFTGPHHVGALEAAERELGPDVGLDWVNAKHAGQDPDGFITSTGRFVTRDEAAKIAAGNGSIPTGPGGALRSENVQ